MIVSAGESLIDFTPLTREGPAEAFRAHPGGSPFNVAIGVARLGQAAAYAGRLSRDGFGRMLWDRLGAEDVSRELVELGPEPTMLAFAGIGSEGEASYEFRADGTADRLFTASGLAGARVDRVEMLHFGSVALARPPAADAVLSAAEMLKGRAFLSLDPNVRPELVEDWGAYHERLRRAVALADLVKVSECDLEALERAGLRLTVAHDTTLVVTRGAVGLRVVAGGAVAHEQPGIAADVVDTVGAGDAAMAALLVVLAERGQARPGSAPRADVWPQALAFAAAAGAAACERPGAQPPTRREILGKLR
jgi:fructokinase